MEIPAKMIDTQAPVQESDAGQDLSFDTPVCDAPQELVDAAIDSRWSLDLAKFGVADMKEWSEETLRSNLTGDRLLDNLILNKYEFSKGITVLKSFPWRLSVPFVLCNARCDFCSAWLVRSETLPVEFIEALAPALRYCYEVDLVGWGEPLIHPELGAIIDIIKREVDSRAKLSLTTNGVKLLDWADRLLEMNIHPYGISIHAATAETHNDIMGLGPNAFDRVCRGIRYLAEEKQKRSAGFSIQAIFIVTRQNIAEIPAFIKLSEELGVTDIFFRTLKPLEEETPGLEYHRLAPYLDPDFESLRAAAIDAIERSTLRTVASPEAWGTPIFPQELAERLSQRVPLPREARGAFVQTIKRVDDRTDLSVGDLDLEYRPKPFNGNPYGRTAPMYCPSPYTALYINGFSRAVSPCCYMTEVPGYQTIHYQKGLSFDAIWNSPAMIALRESLRSGPIMGPCLKCPFYL
jgi:sulfatase maturation enzyme AslB (radical SAM superfamily)